MTGDPEQRPGNAGGAARHTERHEEWIAAVMTGDLARDSAEVTQLRQCEVCCERLRRLERLTGLLDNAGDERRAILDTAVQRPNTTTRRRWPLLCAAAAALLAVAIYLPLRGCDSDPGTGEPNPNLLLGGSHPQAAQITPQGEVESFAAFRWPALQLALDERYVVEVFEESEGGSLSPTPIATSGALTTNSWRPSGDSVARIRSCRSIQWKVLVRNLVTKQDEPEFQVMATHR